MDLSKYSKKERFYGRVVSSREGGVDLSEYGIMRLVVIHVSSREGGVDLSFKVKCYQ